MRVLFISKIIAIDTSDLDTLKAESQSIRYSFYYFVNNNTNHSINHSIFVYYRYRLYEEQQEKNKITLEYDNLKKKYDKLKAKLDFIKLDNRL